MRYSQRWPVYAAQWDRMKINASRKTEFEHIANYAISHKAIYQEIERRSGVPWYMVAVLHRRESDADFDTYLGNGDPLHAVTRHVPRGRGPFATFADGAVDALRLDGLTSVLDWRLEKVLYFCEIYNGTGYYARGLPSPYLWGGTNIQKPGKYIADGVFSTTKWDTQPGTAPMISTINRFDQTVQLVRET